MASGNTYGWTREAIGTIPRLTNKRDRDDAMQTQGFRVTQRPNAFPVPEREKCG